MSGYESFAYSISKRSPILVVSFSGNLSQDSIDKILECRNELLTDATLKFVVIDFSNVTSFAVEVAPSFTQLQKAMRFNGFELRLCAFSDELKSKLMKLGVVRHREITSSLKDALALITRDLRIKALIPGAEKKAA